MMVAHAFASDVFLASKQASCVFSAEHYVWGDPSEITAIVHIIEQEFQKLYHWNAQ
jgi:hypothetical protein